MQNMTVARILTYLGTLPFLYGGLQAFGIAPLSEVFNFDVSRALMGYAVVILSFIAGIHWGVALGEMPSQSVAPTDSPLLNKNHTPLLANKLLISSNVIALWAWALFLFAESHQAWLGLALGFVVLLWIDKSWLRLNQQRVWFWRLRWQASLIAIISMLANAFN